MNFFQDHGLVSDNARGITDVPQNDLIRALDATRRIALEDWQYSSPAAPMLI